jgi:hypothetical protein
MMKTALALMFVFIVSSFAVADDAIVLPKGVFRLRAIPSYSMTEKAYDKDGADATTNAKGTVIAASGALELGLADPLTFGVKWAPGYYAISDLTNPPLAAVGTGKLVYNGPADLELGAKLQILGSAGLLKSDAARFALTAGLVVPLDTYDATAEWNNYLAGKDYAAKSTSGHQSYGFGLKADGDYKINDMFFLNLHGEAKYFQADDSLQFLTVATHAGAYGKAFAGLYSGAPYFVPAGNATAAAAFADLAAPLSFTKTEFGLVTLFEFEPHAAIPLGGKTTLNAGVPVTYSMNLAGTSTYNAVAKDILATSILTVGPNVSLFTLIGPLPVEFQVQYSMPLMGALNDATSTLSLQLKIFGKVF